MKDKPNVFIRRIETKNKVDGTMMTTGVFTGKCQRLEIIFPYISNISLFIHP
jgi:hypothetical protein